MAAKKSSQNPFQWPDGSWHSITWQEQQSRTEHNRTGGVAGQELVASGAAASGGPPPVTPQPVDPALENARLGASWNISTAGGESGYQRGETAWGTGYNADGSLNASNPYSQAMLLQDNYKRAQAAATNSASSSLYSGQRVNEHAHNDRVYAEGSSALKDSTRQAYHGIDYGQLQAYGSNSLGVSGEGYNALRRAVYGG